MRTRWGLILLLTAISVSRVNAQGLSSGVRQAISAGNYRAAIKQLQAIPEAKQTVPELQVLSLLQFADQDPAGAEATCERLTQLAPQFKLKLTEIPIPGSTLDKALKALKPIISIQCFGAGFWNNLGVARLLQGKYAAAAEPLDKASVLQLDWGAPWINGAYVALKRGNVRQAEKSARQGIALGEAGARAKVILAESLIVDQQFPLAERTLNEADLEDPNDPYVSLAKSRLQTVTSQALEAERSKIQAYVGGKPLIVDSLFRPVGQQFEGAGGVQRELHLNDSIAGFSKTIASHLSIAGGEYNQGPGSDSFQRNATANGAVSGPFGTFSLEAKHFDGIRDTLPTSIIASLPQPDSRLQFDRLNLHWQENFGPLTTHLAYRTAEVGVNPTLTAASQQQLRQDQWIAEAQYKTGKWQAGAALTHINRNATGTPAVEPADEVPDNGSSDLSTIYLLRRDTLSRNIDTAVGGVLSGNDGAYVAQVVANSQIRLLGNQILNLGLMPRIRSMSTMLYPSDLTPGSLQKNQIDRVTGSAIDLNNDPAIQSTQGTGCDYVAQLIWLDSQKLRLDTTSFYKLFKDAYFQGLGPGSAPPMFLNLFRFALSPAGGIDFSRTPVSSGTALGITQHVWFEVTDDLSLNVSATLQSTSASYGFQTFGVPTGAVQQAVSETRAPMMPNLSASAGLSWKMSQATATLDFEYVGDRVQAVTAGNVGTPQQTFISRLGSACNANLFIDGRINEASSWVLGILNIGRASFYGGSPTNTSALIGYVIRY